MAQVKTIAFFGASTGCGQSALRHSLSAGHICVALARTPAKFASAFPAAQYPNLVVRPGNAHSADDVAACLINPTDPTRLVDAICFSIGSPLNLAKLTVEDPDVCKKGMAALLAALHSLRTPEKGTLTGKPRLLVVSTTGITPHGRDVPLAFVPMYHFMLKVPHADKKVMEEQLLRSGEDYTIVRPSFLVDEEKPERAIRVGIEDPTGGLISKAVGYVISRGDVGRWIFENLIAVERTEFANKAVSITW